MNSLHHWRYFLSLEREFVESLRYVELTMQQENVFSFEFARLLLLICSELDVVFKIASDHAAPASGADNIGKYFGCLNVKYDLGSEEVRVDRYSRRVKPFQGWTVQTPPLWWTAGNKVKHRRHEHFEQATLGNALSALCGLFVANLIVLHEQAALDHLYETPVLLGRDSEPGHLMLEASYRVNQR